MDRRPAVALAASPRGAALGSHLRLVVLGHEVPGKNLAQTALKWILMHEEVSCVIPGASKPEQVVSNLAANDLQGLTEYELYEIQEIYNRDIKPLVHHLW